MANRWRNSANSGRLYFLGLRNQCRLWLQPWNCKTLFGPTPMTNSYDKLSQHIKKQRHYFANKVPSSQGYCFSSCHIWIWELDYKETWAPKNWCFWTVVLEKTPESPLDCKESKPVHPKGNQPWIFIGRPDAEAEIPIFWPWSEELAHLKKPWCWERLKVGEDGDNRGWGGWMASPTQWNMSLSKVHVLVMEERPGVLQSIGLQRVRHD